MMHPITRLAAAALLTATCAASAQDAHPFAADPVLADLPDRWREIMPLFDVPGATVVVVKDGDIYIETFGVRNVKGEPVTADTMFYIASITKTYLATAVCMLESSGKLSLDDKVKDYLPRFDLADDEAEASITIRDLLSHAAGLTSGEIVTLDAFTGEITDDRYYHWLARVKPDPDVNYSNTHYTLLGRVVENVTGEDWRDHLDGALFAPAGLTRTTGYASEMYGDSNAAQPMVRRKGAWLPVAQVKTDRTMHAAGGLGTSAADAGRYLLLHLQEGRLDGEQLVSAACVHKMAQVHNPYDQPNGSIRIMEGRGLGWEVGTFTGERLLTHGGGYTGASAWFGVLPDHDAAVAVMVNASGPVRVWADIVAIEAIERLSGREAPWSPYERFSARARESKATGADTEAPSAPAPLPSSALSRPIGLYTGAFRSEQFGTLTVEAVEGGLQFRLGDAPLDPAPGDAQDRIRLGGLFQPDAIAEFIVGPGGKIDQIRFTEADYGVFMFVR